MPKMTKLETTCWANGGVWIGGVCVTIPKVSPTKDGTQVRGTPCTHTELTIRKKLPIAVRKARQSAMGGTR